MDPRNLAALGTRAQNLSGDELEELKRRIQLDASDLEARILLAQCPTLPSREEHLSWLLENRADLPFGLAWGFMTLVGDGSSEAHRKRMQQWLTAVDAAGHSLAVVEGAAWYFLLTDPAIGEELYRTGEAQNTADPKWPRLLAAYYEHWTNLTHLRLPTDLLRDLRGRAFRAYSRAFVLEDADDRRFPLIWAMRQCAGPAGETEALRILKLADREAALREQCKEQPVRAAHHAQIAHGLVLLALNDVAEAERHLAGAAAVALTSEPSMVLAQELLKKERFEVVRGYLETCARHLETGAETLRSWSAALQAGATPDLLPPLGT